MNYVLWMLYLLRGPNCGLLSPKVIFYFILSVHFHKLIYFSGADINSWKNSVKKYIKAQTFEGTPKCSIIKASKRQMTNKRTKAKTFSYQVLEKFTIKEFLMTTLAMILDISISKLYRN